MTQIADIDFDSLDHIIKQKYTLNISNIRPMETLSLEEYDTRKTCVAIGNDLLRQGKMGVVILAGGQGSRLGYDHAKGTYNIGINSNISIFQMHINRLLAFWKKEHIKIHCFIMTSSKNNKETVNFFERNNFFGYDKNYIHFFIQGNIVTLDNSYNLMLSDEKTICYSPNGNGFWYKDLLSNGYEGLLRSNGIEWLEVVSVDNVLQNFIDPAFLGTIFYSSASVGAKVVKKINAEEKIGTICINNGHPDILEYFEIPDNIKYEVNSSGELLYSYGVILNYVFKIQTLNQIDFDKLPIHMAHKKVAYLSSNGIIQKPLKENAIKFEYLLTDLIACMDSCISFEVDRQHEFAPIKNLTGDDSVETARELLLQNGFLI